jgi:hypothetical protein
MHVCGAWGGAVYDVHESHVCTGLCAPSSGAVRVVAVSRHHRLLFARTPCSACQEAAFVHRRQNLSVSLPPVAADAPAPPYSVLQYTPPSGTHTATVILCHGLGSSGEPCLLPGHPCAPRREQHVGWRCGGIRHGRAQGRAPAKGGPPWLRLFHFPLSLSPSPLPLPPLSAAPLAEQPWT